MTTAERFSVERAPNLAPPPANPRFPLFDGLRALAALTVFAGHSVTGSFQFASHRNLFLLAAEAADEGVALFFLISGFLLYRPFLTPRAGGPRLGVLGYAGRRAARIVPAYWVALSLFLALGWVGGVTGHNWFVFYGFGQVYGENTIASGIGAAWTLCVEVSFYLALPVFAVVASSLSAGRLRARIDLAMLALLALASLGFRAAFSDPAHFATESTLPGTFLWFAVGMALAVVSVRAQRDRIRPALARLDGGVSWLIALLVFAGLYALTRNQPNLGTAGIAVATFVLEAVVALMIALPAVFDRTGAVSLPRRLLGARALRWVGLVSYGFYLYHTVLIAQLARLLHGAPLPRYLLVTVLSFAATTLCAAASYYLVERPVLRAARLRTQRALPRGA